LLRADASEPDVLACGDKDVGCNGRSCTADFSLFSRAPVEIELRRFYLLQYALRGKALDL
jgi:hypothetical protein